MGDKASREFFLNSPIMNWMILTSQENDSFKAGGL
jgi:hypothetical protein